MPEKYVKEMICDLVGTGKAKGHYSPPEDKYRETRNWYEARKYQIRLHPDTAGLVRKILGCERKNK